MDRRRRGNALLTSLRRLFASGDGVRAPAPAAAPVRQRPARSAVQVGRFSLVGLAHIRDELGARWPALAERVHGLAESVIDHHLVAGDVFEVNAEGDYVVLFCQLTEREAEFKARAIGREITRRLLGSEWKGLSTIETVVAAIPAGAVTGEDLAGVLATAFADGSRFMSSHEDEPAADAVGPGGADRTDPDGLAAFSSALKGAPIGRRPPDWRYTPIWDFQHGALIYFRIAPVSTDRHAGLTGPALIQSIFSADLAALARASADIIQLAASGRRLPIICPLHGGVLEFPARRRAFIEALAEQPVHVRRLLTIELTAPPDWLRSRALEEFIGLVRGMSGGVSTRLPAHVNSLTGLAGISGLVTVQLPPQAMPEASYIRFLETFADRARRTKLTCGVAGLTTRSLVMAASAAGYRYMSGPAIHADVATLDKATRFDFAQLYADIMPA